MNTPHLLRRFLRFLKQTRRYGLLSVLFMGASVALQAPLPLISAWIIDEVFERRNHELLPSAMALLFGTGVVLLASRFGQNYYSTVFSERTKAHLMEALMKKMMRVSVPTFRTYPSGYLLARLRDDVQAVDAVVSNAFIVALGEGAVVVSGAAILLFLNVRLAAVALLLMPLYIVAMKAFNKRLRVATWGVSERNALLTQEIQETLGSHQLVKIFGAEDYHKVRFDKSLAQAVAARIRATVVGAWARLGTGFVTILGPAAILWYGAHEFMNNRLSIGELFAFNTYLAFLFGAASGLISVNFSYQGFKVGLARILEILDKEDNIVELKTCVWLARPRGDVEYEDVWFGYDSDQLVLKGISFEVGAGQLAAVVGKSGAGKSTLLSLCLRLYDPQEGRIRVDGEDLRTLSLKQLRSLIAVVPQETLLMSGTIAENIQYNTVATNEEIHRAAVLAHADEFISRLPNKYETYAGERGMNFSSGQRQRIAIARALLRRPKILIFDEATSALDVWSEQLISEALRNLRGTLTIFTIAHRLYTVTSADKILFLEHGRLIAQGTHQELHSTCPQYAFLFETQFGQVERASALPLVPTRLASPEQRRDTLLNRRTSL